jgi:dipeptidyl aminopeptidase/acylaminoacyl peptidase
MQKKYFILTCILIFVGLVIYSLHAQQNKSQSNISQTLSPIAEQSPLEPSLSPTPFPFQEYTIPYLRERVYDSEVGELRPLSTSSGYASYLTDYDSDGLTINALLTKPAQASSSNKAPAIVFIHGYIPPSVYKTQERYQAYVDYFAQRGFVVFKIDLRGHGNSEGEASGAYYSSDYIVDTLNAHKALQSLDFIDPDRIGLWGHSMAGNVVLRSIAAKRDIPAAVIFAGAVYTYQDMRDFGIDDNSYRPPTNNTNRQRLRQQLFDTYGQFDAGSFFWQQVAPVNYLNDVATSLQVHHPVDDQVVSVEYARNLGRVLQAFPLKHEIVEYPSGGHNFTGVTFSQAMQKSVKFFEENL